MIALVHQSLRCAGCQDLHGRSFFYPCVALFCSPCFFAAAAQSASCCVGDYCEHVADCFAHFTCHLSRCLCLGFYPVWRIGCPFEDNFHQAHEARAVVIPVGKHLLLEPQSLGEPNKVFSNHGLTLQKVTGSLDFSPSPFWRFWPFHQSGNFCHRFPEFLRPQGGGTMLSNVGQGKVCKATAARQRQLLKLYEYPGPKCDSIGQTPEGIAQGLRGMVSAAGKRPLRVRDRHPDGLGRVLMSQLRSNRARPVGHARIFLGGKFGNFVQLSMGQIRVRPLIMQITKSASLPLVLQSGRETGGAPRSGDTGKPCRLIYLKNTTEHTLRI